MSKEDSKTTYPGELASPSLKNVKLEIIIDSIDEAIIGCDKNGYINIYNSANEFREKMNREAVLNCHVNDIYDFHGGNSLMMRAMQEKKSILDQYQEYTVKGSNTYVEIICSTVPIISEGEIIGAVSVMKDYSKMKKLSKIITDLQSDLYNSSPRTKKGRIASASHTLSDIIGNNKLLQDTLHWAYKTAENSLPVLIYGETGTGKELLAQGIHNAGSRRNKPFIAINCAAIPENLLEGLLFGTARGAFTGAVDRPGLFEQASEGTIMLDEINSMSLPLQSKLLRVIQEEAVLRIGDNKERRINTRLISIANCDPLKAIHEGQLREDLYYRIAYITLKMPPLRNRKDDLPILIKYLVEKYNRKLNLNVETVSPELFRLLEQYPWPGNIRELEHLLAAGISALDEGSKVITPSDLPPIIRHKFNTNNQSRTEDRANRTLEQIMEKIERRVLETALSRNGWNISRTARELGLKRQSLQYRIRKYALLDRTANTAKTSII